VGMEAGAADPLADQALATRLAGELRGSVLRTPGLGWMERLPAVWSPLSDQVMLDRVSKLVTMIGGAIVIEAGLEKVQKFAVVGSKKKAADVMALLAGQLEELDAVFDVKPFLVNCPNGVYNIRTKKFRQHKSTDRFLKTTGCDYVAGARSAAWEEAWSAVDVETAPWLRLRLGQALSGERPSDDRVLFLRGDGSNGKSVIVDAISLAMGGYALAAPPKVLLSTPSDHSTELMTLRNVRMALLEELPDQHLAGAQLKRLSGPREITARLIGQNNVSFPAQFSLFVTTNYPLRTPDTDYGTWRRFAIVPFFYKYVDEPVVEREGERLRDSALKRWSERVADPGVLAWLLEAAYDAEQDKVAFSTLPIPVALATDEARRDNDTLSQFCEERLVLEQGQSIPKSDLHKAYSDWARGQNLQPVSSPTFRQRFMMSEFGKHVQESRSSSARSWVGVRLRERLPFANEVTE
jgi:putative DNA primase/helicase